MSILSFLIAFFGISWAAEFHLAIGFVLYTEQFLCTILALTLALIFPMVPARRSALRSSVPWYDAAAAPVGFGASLYLALRYPVLAEEFFYRPKETFTISIILIPLVVDALRRTSGSSLTVLLLLFIASGLFSEYVPVVLQGGPMPFTKLVSFLGVDNVAMLSLPMTIICTVVIIFLGQILDQSGGSAWFTDLGAATLGAIAGVWAASTGLMGYLFVPLSVVSRIGMLAGGLALLVPATVFGGATAAQLFGIAMVALFVGREVLKSRRTETS